MPPKGKAKSKAKADSSGAPKAKGKAKAKASPAAGSGAKAAAELRKTASDVAAEPAAAEAAAEPEVECEAPAPAIEPVPAAAAVEAQAAAEPAAADVPADKEEAAEPQPPPAPTAMERAKRLEEEAPDPWGAVAEDDAFRRIGEEAWDSIVEGLGEELEGASGGAHVIAKDAGLSDVSSASDALPRRAVSFDFSENQLEKVDSLPALWLRHLSLAGNPLSSLEGLSALFPKLLAVDLSFVDLPSIDGSWEALAACPRLRSLVAESAGVSTFEDMPTFAALQSLELVENDVEEVSEVGALAKRCPALIRLDLRENPLVSEPFYVKAIAKHLPKLVWHNNQSTKKYTAKDAARGKCYVAFDKEVNAVDGLYKNEGCSCIEGNPCLDPSTCIDWENREAVAAEARRKKGLRGPAGEFV